MKVEKIVRKTNAVIPLMAVFPYSIEIDGSIEPDVIYDPDKQLTQFAGRGYSTCRYDESAGGLFESKSDTQKDD